MAKQLTVFKKENTRLKQMVAQQALDMEILNESTQGNRKAPSGYGERSMHYVGVGDHSRCRSVEHVVSLNQPCSTSLAE